MEYEHVVEELEKRQRRIEEIAETDRYRESVHKLICLKGVRTLTVLAVIVEVGDFARFMKAKNFVAFPGLSVGENSSTCHRNCGHRTCPGHKRWFPGIESSVYPGDQHMVQSSV
ncbi:MAG: transposase [Bulleidia sp.]